MTVLNESAVRAADAVVDWAAEQVLASLPETAVVVEAPAGAGKSYAVITIALRLAARGQRVGITAFTNDQVQELVRGLALRNSSTPALHLHSDGMALEAGEYQGRVHNSMDAGDASRFPIVLATLNKMGQREPTGHPTLSFDVLIVDEAFQASMTLYLNVGDVADRHLLVGDRGQLDPFVAADGAVIWRGHRYDPAQHAVSVLERNRPESILRRRLPVTRRLDPRAVPVARLFYAGDHHFESAVLPGVRQLAFSTPQVGDPLDALLQHAAASGWGWHEVRTGPNVDLDMAERITQIIQRLLDAAPQCTVERADGGGTETFALRQEQIGVAVPHNRQRVMLRHLLTECGLGEVEVLTANKMQGLTYQVVIAWHPFAGLDELDPFHLDPGRLCVMLTRHKQACIVVSREGDAELLEALPPQPDVWLNVDEEPALQGWLLHERVMSILTEHRR